LEKTTMKFINKISNLCDAYMNYFIRVGMLPYLVVSLLLLSVVTVIILALVTAIPMVMLAVALMASAYLIVVSAVIMVKDYYREK
jgi:hypothetical protein